eukprot:jgi/Chlat1/1920/Chrsp152S02233
MVDVEQTLMAVVDALLGDRTVPKATTTARAKALQKLKLTGVPGGEAKVPKNDWFEIGGSAPCQPWRRVAAVAKQLWQNWAHIWRQWIGMRPS